MNSNASPKVNLKEHSELIETVAKIEYKKLSASHLLEFQELINIGTHTIHYLFVNAKSGEEFNKTYLTTAIKWAIRNEVRRRYKWYSLKTKSANIASQDAQNDIREAVYKTILSIDEMQDSENPTQFKDSQKTPEEKLVFHELSEAIKIAIKNLPPRERDLIENKFFKDKKLKELAKDFEISPSRISRIIQSGLNRIKKDLAKQQLT